MILSASISLTRYITLILLVFSSVSFNNLSNLVQAKLIFVSEVYRHGARGARSKFNFYDGKNQSEIANQLTPTGQRQHYNLGQMLRKEYITDMQFMPSSFNHSLIYVQSDNMDRTIMSALSHFQGFYPQMTGAKLPKDLQEKYTLPPFKNNGEDYEGPDFIEDDFAFPHGIQVLPVHMKSNDEDLIFLSGDICLNYKLFTADFIAKHLNISAFIDKHMAETYIELSIAFKQPILGWLESAGLYDVIISDYYNGRHVPYLSSHTKNALSFLNDFYWSFMQSGSIRAVKLITTPMMQDIISKLDAAVAKQQTLQWLSFSGHDSNIAPLLVLLNFTDYQCVIDKYLGYNNTALNCATAGPAFASSIIFELHEEDQQEQQPEEGVESSGVLNYVRIRYNGVYMHLCERNQTTCGYQEFRTRIQQGFPKNFAEECVDQNKLKKILKEEEVVQGNISIFRILEDTSLYGNGMTLMLVYFILGQILVIAFGYVCLKKATKNHLKEKHIGDDLQGQSQERQQSILNLAQSQQC